MSIQVMLLTCASLSFMLVVSSLLSWRHRPTPPRSRHVDVLFSGILWDFEHLFDVIVFHPAVSELLGQNRSIALSLTSWVEQEDDFYFAVGQVNEFV